MPERIVIDTSAFIALEKLNLLSLLCDVYSEIFITEAINKEFGELKLPCLSIKKTQSNLINLLINDLRLGRGEAEVIALASENKMKVMIDDLKARKIAQDLGLKVTGTIGFLLNAYDLGLIASAHGSAQKLRAEGFYVSDKLLAEIKQLEKNKK